MATWKIVSYADVFLQIYFLISASSRAPNSSISVLVFLF